MSGLKSRLRAAANCSRVSVALSALIAPLVLAGAPQQIDPHPSSQEIAVRQWVERWGDKMTERYHPDIQEQYPGGRSDRYHDAYVADVFREFGLPTNTNWRILNKHYAYDGEWFIVEWLFEAKDKKSGRLQREGTLAFGHIKDDRLIGWIEYFDGFVAHLQRAGALPLFRVDEMPFPWPDYDGTSRKYRP